MARPRGEAPSPPPPPPLTSWPPLSPRTRGWQNARPEELAPAAPEGGGRVHGVMPGAGASAGAGGGGGGMSGGAGGHSCARDKVEPAALPRSVPCGRGTAFEGQRYALAAPPSCCALPLHPTHLHPASPSSSLSPPRPTRPCPPAGDAVLLGTVRWAPAPPAPEPQAATGIFLAFPSGWVALFFVRSFVRSFVLTPVLILVCP